MIPDRSAARAREPDFVAWYREAAAGVTRQIVGAVGDAALGREAAAEAFARAYERWPRVGRLDRPEAWVVRVAVNDCRRTWRRRAMESRALARLGPGMTGVSPGVDYDEDLYRAIRALPQRMRTAVRLRYWDGLSEAEVARRMSVAPGTASALLSTARDRLRRVLGGSDQAIGGGV